MRVSDLYARPKPPAKPPGGSVLDPFCGSGTTLLAAKELGFQAVGIECEESHCETIARRMSQGVLWRQNEKSSDAMEETK